MVPNSAFVSGCDTTDVIHPAHLLIEKHLEKEKPLRLAILVLEEACDRIPHKVVVRAYGLRSFIPITGVKCRRLSYVNKLSHDVGVHQGSAPFPLLFRYM